MTVMNNSDVLRRTRPDRFWPFKLMVSLLYTKHDYVVTEDDGTMIIPTKKWADSLRIRTGRLRPYLETLNNMGLLDRYTWGGAYCVVRVVPPNGWARTVQDTNQEVVDL